MISKIPIDARRADFNVVVRFTVRRRDDADDPDDTDDIAVAVVTMGFLRLRDDIFGLC